MATPFKAPDKPLAFQDLILTLQKYWGDRGCAILQPYDEQVGAGTLHPATVLRALRREPVDCTPVWLMRQAGRYLPEYRATRAQAGDFLSLCYTPELAAEVTLQPIRRYGFDAAILFADILLIPQALGMDLWFVTGEGPRLSTVTTPGELAALKPAEAIHETLSPVYETVRILSRELPRETTLIGFAGAPWTVATYVIAGQGTCARELMAQTGGLDMVVAPIGGPDDKPGIVVAVNGPARDRGLNAGELVRIGASELGGKGGGKPDLAQGGGTDGARADQALGAVERAVSGG